MIFFLKTGQNSIIFINTGYYKLISLSERKLQKNYLRSILQLHTPMQEYLPINIGEIYNFNSYSNKPLRKAFSFSVEKPYKFWNWRPLSSRRGLCYVLSDILKAGMFNRSNLFWYAAYRYSFLRLLKCILDLQSYMIQHYENFLLKSETASHWVKFWHKKASRKTFEQKV